MPDKIEAPVADEPEKVTLRLAGEAMRVVRAQAARKGISINEFMRRAIGTEAYLLDQIEQGGRLLIERADKSIREVVLR